MNNISKLKDYKGLIIYRATCSCMCPSHDKTLILEYDPNYGGDGVSLHLECSVAKADFRTRLKFLWTGKLDGYNYTSFVFSGAESVRDYIKALSEGLDRVLVDSKSKNPPTTP